MTDDPIATILATFPTMVLDGGLATELEARGADLHDPLWSAKVLVEDPHLIREVHEAYFAAGADVAISASYQATFEGVGRRGFERDRAEGLFRRSVELAQEARGAFWSAHEHEGRPAPLVAASVGPYGAMLGNGAEYTGDYDRGRDELLAFHLPRMEALATAGPDLLAVETIPSIVEAEALADALERIPEVPAWVSFSCRNGAELCDGAPFERAVDAVSGVPNVVAVGVNCTAPSHIDALVRIAADRTSTPIVVYPNRGAFWDPMRRVWVDPPRQDARPTLRPVEWAGAGARLIGGCCGTGPSDVETIASALGR